MIRLKLDRMGEVFTEVPDDAKFIVDMDYTVNTKKLWNTVFGRYQNYHLRVLKVWVKQDDGSYKLKWWPTDYLQEKGRKNRASATTTDGTAEPKQERER